MNNLVIEGKRVGDKIIINEPAIANIKTRSGKKVEIRIVTNNNTSHSGQEKQEITINGAGVSNEDFAFLSKAIKYPSILTDGPPLPSISQLKVLPETIVELVNEIENPIISEELLKRLSTTAFTGFEVRDQIGLPDVNIFIPQEEGDEAEVLERDLLERMRNIIQFLNLDPNIIKSGAIIIDPISITYNDASAFFHTTRNRVWVKQNKLSNFDHEATHWLTNIFPQNEGLHRNYLINEGLASWVAWNVKSTKERENCPEENYQKNAKRAWSNVFTENEIHLNMQIHNIPAMPLGAILWQVISETLNDNKKLMEHWQKIDQFENISEWIVSMSLDPDQIEKAWKKLVFEEELST